MGVNMCIASCSKRPSAGSRMSGGFAALTSLAAPGSAERHCEDERNQFCARVLAADAGVRHVIKSNPEADQIVEAIVEFRAGAELGMGPRSMPVPWPKYPIAAVG